MAGSFDDLNDLFGKIGGSKSKEEKGVPWTAKIIAGETYVPMEQVAELLEQNGVLPKVRAGLERTVARYRQEYKDRRG